MGNRSKDFATIRVCRMLWGNNSSQLLDSTLLGKQAKDKK